MNSLIDTLRPFGLSEEESTVYIFLVKNGTKSALELSRGIHLGRTKVYRILNLLIEKGLVTQKLDDMGFKFLANDYRQLEFLLRQKEAEVESLKQSLPAIYTQMASVVSAGEEKSKVLYYHGINGLAQVTWNSTKATGDGLRIFEVAESMAAFLDQKVSEKMRTEFVRNKVKIKQLTNSLHIPPYTKVKDFTQYIFTRYIDPKVMTIDFEFLVYNDVFTLYGIHKNEQFCVEIYNDNLAATQKKLFDFVWDHAKKMKVLNEQGEATISR